MENQPRAKVKDMQAFRARVISGQRTDVTSVPAVDATPVGDHILPASPEDFARYCRQHLGVSETYGLYPEDIKKVAEDFDITPLAFFNPGSHWVLVVRAHADGVVAYDPLVGLKDVRYGRINIIEYVKPKTSPEDKDNQLMLLPTDFHRLQDDGYNIPEEPLAQLARVQYDPVNCGPLILFAANFARSCVSPE